MSSAESSSSEGTRDSEAEVRRLLGLVDSTMIADRHRLRRMLGVFGKGKRPGGKVIAEAGRLLEASIARVEERRRSHPAIGENPRVRFDDPLPICERIDEIAAAIEKHSVVVVAGETGSGKSTQLPKICLKLGRGVYGLIGHTQPRRIAARSIATRLAEDLGTRVGDDVGFKVRFTDAVSPKTHIKVMTDGILLAEIQSDRFLDQYDTLIIDEAHERSLNIDLILGHLHRLIRRRRDLRVIITSATIDAARFAAFFDAADGVVVEPEASVSDSDATSGNGPISPLTQTARQGSPVIEVSGRTYPVETRYRPVEADDSGEIDEGAAIADAVTELLQEGRGDTLVFLPTERDIRDVAEVLRGRFHSKGRGAASDVEILPLYGRLSERDQHRVFETHSTQRIVLATNVAESSLTVPGIRYVVDTGTARISRFTPQSKVQRLPIEPISRASADQRKGRCGRTGPGICVRLYSQQEYLEREAYTPPEILRTNLSAAVLQTIAYGLGDLTSLPLLDRPQPGAVRAGYATLAELGATKETAEGVRLTEIGKTLSKLPVDPRIGRMIVAAHDEHCLAEVLVIAAALEVRDPRDRPPEKQQAADEAHKQFVVEGSDFLTLIKIWDVFQGWSDKLSNSQLRKACQRNFLSYTRMREWRDLHRQLAQIVSRAGMRGDKRHEDADAIHRALLTGLLSNIALKGDANEYTGAGDQTLYLWPGSAVFAKKPKWIVAAELVETTRRFARTVGPINPDWIEKLAPLLVKRSHSDAQWDRNVSAAIAFERVMLYGLPVVPRRRCRLATYDAPKAREMFIQNALVEGDYETRAEYHRHNLALKEELKDWQAKLRKTQLFASEEQQFQFFDSRLPATVVDGATFDKWRREAEKTNPTLLHLSKNDLLVDPEVELTEQAFPNALAVGGGDAKIEYRLDPASRTDGLTLVVPVGAARELDASRLGWLVPGMLADKVESLIKVLPKELRRLFVPIPDTAREVVRRLKFGEGELTDQVAAILRQLFGEHVPADSFELSRLPDYLRFKVRAVNEQGETLASGDDVAALQHQLRGETAAAFATLAQSQPQWTKDGLKDWSFGSLPRSVELKRGTITAAAYPMLVDQGTAIGLRLAEDVESADRSTRRALVRLFRIVADAKIDQQVAWLPKIENWSAQAASVSAAAETFAKDLGGEPGAAAGMSAKARATHFRRQLATRIAERACAVGEIPRSEGEYRQWLKRANGQLAVATQDVAELLDPLLSKAREVQKLLTGREQSALEASRRDAQSQWVELLRNDFLAEASWEALTSYPRYFDGILLRWKKLLTGGLARDRELTATIGVFWNKYLEIMRRRPELENAFRDVRWMIEEFRLGLFAQSLRSGVAVSDKRLREAWESAIAASKRATAPAPK